VSRLSAPRQYNLFLAAGLLALFALCHLASPVPAFHSPEEGASWLLARSIVTHRWAGLSLAIPAPAIDPEGIAAGPFARASGGRWYSTIPPLLPVVASVPMAIAGAAGAWAVPAFAVIICAFLSIRIGERIAPEDPPARLLFALAVAASPILVHGILFSGVALAAALVLASLDAAMGALFAASRPPRAAVLKGVLFSLLFAGLAAIARPEAVWITVAIPAAWLSVRRARVSFDRPDGGRAAILFLAWCSAFFVAAAGLLAAILPRLLGEVRPAWEAAGWGSPLVLPVVVPAMLAAIAVLRGFRFGPRAGASAMLLGLLFVVGAASGGAGLREVLLSRESHAELVAAIAASARPGEAILVESGELSGLAATLATSRALFCVSPGVEPEMLLHGLEENGIAAVTAVSPALAGAEEALAGKSSFGRYVREGEPRRAGDYLIARFAGGGLLPSRPSLPPRGD